jgi:hypothetical protein
MTDCCVHSCLLERPRGLRVCGGRSIEGNVQLYKVQQLRATARSQWPEFR